MRITAATVAHLVALQENPAEFGRLVGAIPEGWPEFPESVTFTLDRLQTHPEEADWWMHIFVDGDAVVGSGGYVGPPADGVVEIGYEVAPALRRKGYATAGAKALIDKACAGGGVTMVVANTLPDVDPSNANASVAVLRKLGFERAGEAEDPDVGTVWHWQLPVAQG